MLGLNVNEDVRVFIGEIREQLIADLDKCNISYSIAFDKANKFGVKDTIIHIQELELEISLTNDIINFIKTSNNEYSHLIQIKDIGDNVVDTIKEVKGLVISKLGISDRNVKIEKLDTKTLHLTLVITDSNNKIRTQIIRDNFGNVFIHTLKSI